MQALQAKVCVITGGAGSIGRESARLFLREGARVMLVDLDAEALARTAAELGEQNVGWVAADVGDAAATQDYVRHAVATFGKIDVIVSNAGNTGIIAPLSDYPEEVFDAVMRVHVRGAFLACKYGMAAMNDGGSIVITSSVAGVRGDPGVYAYITAKHAQVGLMRAVAKEAAARGIRVNTIHPGPVDNAFQAAIEKSLSAVLQRNATEFFNDRIPLRRHATPSEIARSVLYLASDASSFTTGSRLMVDGGMSA